ncbi:MULTISPECIES: hypothetical protein [unclassified Bradyrhizobium]|uniref:hypothetical protein n=1 Tax=unclassified Bradyrhizobium TaxID=2631580 RepID=UPI001FEFAFA1|nr:MULTISPECIES: hypothetical protein [unclassified Bradyrhizobium]
MFGIRRASSALRALLALTILAAAPAFAAESGCAHWDVSGGWTLIQTNDTAVSLTLQETKTGLSGSAKFGHYVNDNFFLCHIGSCGKEYVGSQGSAVGTVNGDAFDLSIYWDNNAIGVYTGRIGPQGLIVGTTFDKNDPRTTAQWHSNRVATCSAAAQTPPTPPEKPALALGRIQNSGASAPSSSLCDAAKSARARNSPAAPELERQCNAYLAAKLPPAPVTAPADRTTSAKNSSSAQNSPPPPVQKPSDLVIGRISYAVGGQQVTQPIVGTPVAISCTYAVDEVASPLGFKIQPWRGSIRIGGPGPQTLEFQGDPHAGQHEARQIWTPTAAGRTPVSCVLNPGFENAEANPGNNRWDETINVVAGDKK